MGEVREGISFLGSMRAVIAIAFGVLLPTTSFAVVSCSGVFGQVSEDGFSIDPAQPRVGDDVLIHFDTTISVYSLNSVTLAGATPFFTGSTSTDRSGVFHLHAVQAGEAHLVLAISFGTEEECMDEETGSHYFREGPTITERFGEHLVTIAAEPTPTPTSTPTFAPTFTPTPMMMGGNGCGIDAGQRSNSLALVLAVLPWLARRRSRLSMLDRSKR